MARRTCEHCGAVIPWGTPQCLECGRRTVWWRVLTGIGIVIGVGTALAALAAVARVWFIEPPAPIRAEQQVRQFLALVQQDARDRNLVQGAGRCRNRPAEILCVRVTA